MTLARRAGLRSLDAYAHHPYYSRPSETPASRPGGSAVELGNINTLITAVNKLWGKKRIWITEYGWQTRPPDNLFGVSYARQAAYVRQSYAIARANPRIDLMVVVHAPRRHESLDRVAVRLPDRRRCEEAVL